MKDVISCDKLRGLANTNRSVDFRMGQPDILKEYHQLKLTRRTETSKYPEEEKTKSDSPSSGERTGNSPNLNCYGKSGVVGLQCGLQIYSGSRLESGTIEGDRPVHDIYLLPSSILSTAGSETPCGNLAAPSAKAKY